jgi:hypothetical protein
MLHVTVRQSLALKCLRIKTSGLSTDTASIQSKDKTQKVDILLWSFDTDVTCFSNYSKNKGKAPLRLKKHYAIKAKSSEGGAPRILNLESGGGELNRRPGGSHSRSECLEEGEVPYPAWTRTNVRQCSPRGPPLHVKRSSKRRWCPPRKVTYRTRQ